MSFRRTLILSVLGAGLAAPVAAQGIPRGATISNRPTTAATRIMVATPFVFASADSATAVEVGRAMRERMTRAAPRTYSVIPDSVMNAALAQYDYPRDAILNRALAQTLAQQINGRVLVTSQMAKGTNGQWSMVARLSGTNDGAGNTVRLAQEGRTPPAMGAAAVDALQPALRSLEDARECMNLRVSKPQDAAKKAQEALKDMPNNGLAHYCLAQMAQGAEKIRHLEQAVHVQVTALHGLDVALVHRTARLPALEDRVPRDLAAVEVPALGRRVVLAGERVVEHVLLLLLVEVRGHADADRLA